MAIIYTYPLNKDIKLTDELVGTTEVTINGSKKTRTRNFLISDLVDFFAGGQIILTTNGNSGPSTFDTITKELNIPDYTSAGVGNLQQVTLNGNETTLYIKASGFKTFGGTDLQYLMADGSTRTSSSVNLQSVTTAGNSTTDQIIASSFKKTGGQPTEFLMADGTVSTYSVPTLQAVTTVGNITTTSVRALSFIKTGGSNLEYLMADGSTTIGSSDRPVILVSIPTDALAVTNTEYIYLIQNPVTLTLPDAIGNTNKYNVKSVSSGTVTIATYSSQTIDDTPSSIQLPVKYSSLTLVSNGTNWVII
jgi:hypothetical protein